MQVPPHPHTGLQTVSWLFEGEIEHRDTTGVHELVTPGALTLMTAGRGIAHSEVSTSSEGSLHGVQLWVVLPDNARHQEPHCFHSEPLIATLGDARVSLFVGSLPQIGTNAAPTYWPMFGAEVVLPAGGETTLELPEGHELAVLVDKGTVELEGVSVSANQLAYLGPGHPKVTLRSVHATDTRLIVLGGLPFPESIVMWWNFIGRSHEEIVAYREAWQAGLQTGSELFGHLDHMPALPAPEMPSVTLKPRTRR
jgi:redox-sensitive bicupin YhaK (pirin superfamily)